MTTHESLQCSMNHDRKDMSMAVGVIGVHVIFIIYAFALGGKWLWYHQVDLGNSLKLIGLGLISLALVDHWVQYSDGVRSLDHHTKHMITACLALASAAIMVPIIIPFTISFVRMTVGGL